MAQSQRLDLLVNASATGSWLPAQPGGRYVFAIEGTFGGATAQLQMKGPNGTGIDLANGSFTANGAVAVDTALGGEFRVTLTGGAPSGMFAMMARAEL